MSWVIALVCASFLGVSVIISSLFHEHAPHAYMDEIFHFPQTRQYCEGHWDKWDNKITTFPGLYVLSVGWAKLVALLPFKIFEVYCSLSPLRWINILFNTGNTFLILQLRCMMEDSNNVSWKTMLHGIAIALFPVNFFFTFLFYTDPGALFFVLLAYYFTLKGRSERFRHGPLTKWNCLGVMAGYAALGFRQTNIIWILFILGNEIVCDIEATHGKKQTNALGQGDDSRNDRLTLFQFVGLLFKNLPRIVLQFYPFLSIVAAFAAFLAINGSITVGDKSNHVAMFHFTQLMYFAVVAMTGCGLSIFARDTISELLKFARKWTSSVGHFVGLIIGLSLFAFAIYRFSHVHSFLLADNRHYPFYVWRKFFLKHPLMKMVPIPIYLYSIWYLWTNLRASRSNLQCLVFLVATSLVLIPTPLVEPRYYIVPFVLYHIHLTRQTYLDVVLTIMLNTFVNAITIYVYLFKPYQWPDGSEARFMW